VFQVRCAFKSIEYFLPGIMQVVDRIASSGYSYISPTLDRACDVLPLLGKVKQRIEPYPPALIQTVDGCIDTVYGVVEVRATALRTAANSAGSKALGLKHSAYAAVEERAIAVADVVTSTCGKAQKIVGESVVVVRVHKTSLAIVDTLDMLIDRYLPEPHDKDLSNEAKDKAPKDLIPRMLYMPFKIPVRMIYISIAKAQNGYHVVEVGIQSAIKLTSEQKEQLQALLLSRGRAIADTASSSSLVISLGQGRQRVVNTSQIVLQTIDDGRKAVGAKCYIMCERMHVIEMRDWSLKTVEALSQATMVRASDMCSVATQRVYDISSFVVGQDRAADMLTLVSKRLPFVKVVVHSAGSTGALSDSSSHDVDQAQEDHIIESSTGETGKASVPKIEIPPKDEAAVREDDLSP
jgi:hypothetical protein